MVRMTKQEQKRKEKNMEILHLKKDEERILEYKAMMIWLESDKTLEDIPLLWYFVYIQNCLDELQ